LKLQQLDIATGDVQADAAVSVSFGKFYPSTHSATVVLLKPALTTEQTISNIKVYLTHKGTAATAEVGYNIAKVFTANVEAGSETMSKHLVLGGPTHVANPPSMELGDMIWLDIQAGPKGTGVSSLNVRFEYDYE
jgi:hypothetical protein